MRRLIEVRRSLHELVASNGGAGLQRRAVTTLNEAARRVRLGVRLHPVDGYRLVAEGVGVDRPIGELLMSVTAAMAAGNWNRLKVCANDACQRTFYDSSRNRSGRWCSMATCGNRMKGRAYRQRHGSVRVRPIVAGRPTAPKRRASKRCPNAHRGAIYDALKNVQEPELGRDIVTLNMVKDVTIGATRTWRSRSS